MTSPLSKTVRQLHNWGFFTDTRRKKALREWQEDTQALVTLFEKGMDPLIARAVYNQRYCTPLYRLPDEIFLRIIGFLYQDEVSFFITRQVCRRFRLLLKLPQFSHHRFVPPEWYETPNEQNMGDLFLGKSNTSGYSLPPPPLPTETQEDATLRVKIALLLHIDSYCISCLKDDRPAKRGAPQDPEGFCHFYRGQSRHCVTCGVWHQRGTFPKTERGSKSIEDCRRPTCIGTRGYVRLCEHQAVTWAEMKATLSVCKIKIPPNAEPDYEVGMDIKTCQRIEHHRTECVQSSPSARLFCKKTGHWRLEITWEPHSGPGAFTSYRPGKFKAAEMRNLFRQYRKSAAQFIVPEIVHNVLPEMTCFRIGECSCLSYGNEDEVDELLYGNAKMQVRDDLQKTHTPLDTITQQCNHQQPYQASQHAHVRVEICQGTGEKDVSRSPCIVTIYKRIVEGFCPGDGTKMIPSHDWLHAVDRTSYRLGSTWGFKETCTDPSCRNSYPLSIHGCNERHLGPGYNVNNSEVNAKASQHTPSSKTSKDAERMLFHYVVQDNPSAMLIGR